MTLIQGLLCSGPGTPYSMAPPLGGVVTLVRAIYVLCCGPFRPGVVTVACGFFYKVYFLAVDKNIA